MYKTVQDRTAQTACATLSELHIKKGLDNKNKQAKITVYSEGKSKKSKSRRGITNSDARSFVMSLNERVFCDRRYLPFYCNAVLKLGTQKLLYLQSMALDPTVKSPERMFAWLLKQELEAIK